MIRAWILFLAAIFITISAHSQNINKGFRKLKREKYIQAKVIFDEVLKTDEIAEHPAAFHGLASIFNSLGYQGHNQAKALYSSIKAMETFQKLNKEQKEKAADIISRKEMQEQLQALDEQYVQFLRQKRDLVLTAMYLNMFSSIPKREEMITFRNQLAWQQTKKHGTIPGYNRYINKYPDSKYVQKARSAIIQLEYEKASRSEDAVALMKFYYKYPQSSLSKKARKKAKNLEYKKAKELNSIEYYEYFLRNFPNSDKISEIVSLRNKKAFEMAQLQNSVKAYEEFMSNYPNAEQFQQAKQMRNKVAYQNALEKNTVRAFRDFIQKYPDAKQVDELQKKLQEINLSSP